MKKIHLLSSLLAVSLLITGCKSNHQEKPGPKIEPPETREITLSKADYYNKTLGGLLGQFAGFLSGYEFVWNGPDPYVGMPEEWFDFINGPYAGNFEHYVMSARANRLRDMGGVPSVWSDDDFHIDIFNQTIMDEYGYTSEDIKNAWVKYKVKYAAQQKADAELYSRQKQAEAEAFELQRQAEAEAFQRQKKAEAEKVAMENEAAGKKAIAEAVQAQGEAEAAAIKAKLVAEADGMREKAEALKQYGDAAKQQMQLDALKVYFEQLPKIAEASGKAYQNVEKIYMYGGDSSKLTKDIMTNVTQVSESLGETLGLDLKSVLGKLIENKIEGKAEKTPDKK